MSHKLGSKLTLGLWKEILHIVCKTILQKHTFYAFGQVFMCGPFLFALLCSFAPDLVLVFIKPAVVAGRSKSSCFKFKVRQRLRSQVWIPTWDNDIDSSEVEMHQHLVGTPLVPCHGFLAQVKQPGLSPYSRRQIPTSWSSLGAQM